MSGQHDLFRGSKNSHPPKFEDCYRVYHEVEDVGKTVRATKRRARWTFSFGERGQEREVVLAHSVVSGKKTITYDGRQIHHSEELSRTFSHSWFDGDHALRVDITDLVDVGRGRNDKMYELTLDGVPFGVLPLRPVHLPRLMEPNAQGPTAQGSLTTRKAPGQRETDEAFNPRGIHSVITSVGSRPKLGMSHSQQRPTSVTPPVDLLGGWEGDGGGLASDPFSGPASKEQFADFTASFNEAKGRSNATAHDLVKEFGGTSEVQERTTPLSMPPLTYGKPLPTFTYVPGPGANISTDKRSTTALVRVATKDDSGEVDVDKATASLVNLNNLLDDEGASGSISPSKLYSSVYVDNRSLEEIKASRAARAPQPLARPIFIDRTPPPEIMTSPGAQPFLPGRGMLSSPMQQQHMMGGTPQPWQQPVVPPTGPAMMGGGKYLQQQSTYQQRRGVPNTATTSMSGGSGMNLPPQQMSFPGQAMTSLNWNVQMPVQMQNSFVQQHQQHHPQQRPLLHPAQAHHASYQQQGTTFPSRPPGSQNDPFYGL